VGSSELTERLEALLSFLGSLSIGLFVNSWGGICSNPTPTWTKNQKTGDEKSSPEKNIFI